METLHSVTSLITVHIVVPQLSLIRANTNSSVTVYWYTLHKVSGSCRSIQTIIVQVIIFYLNIIKVERTTD